MKALVYSGVIKKGRVDISDRTKAQYLEGLARWKEGARVRITVERQVATRSLDANAFWWSVCVVQVLETLQAAGHLEGWTPDDLHDLAKAVCLSKEDAAAGRNGHILGERYVIGGSTTKLNKLEFGEFIKRWKVYCAEKFRVEIPEADRDWREKVPLDSSGRVREGFPAELNALEASPQRRREFTRELGSSGSVSREGAFR